METTPSPNSTACSRCSAASCYLCCGSLSIIVQQCTSAQTEAIARRVIDRYVLGCRMGSNATCGRTAQERTTMAVARRMTAPTIPDHWARSSAATVAAGPGEAYPRALLLLLPCIKSFKILACYQAVHSSDQSVRSCLPRWRRSIAV